MSQAAVAAHNARNACHARGVASLRTAVGVAGARAVVCDTAGAAVAGLSTGAAGVAADLTVRATRSTETGSGSGTPGPAAADTGVTTTAGITVRAITVGATLAAGPTATVLAGGTAGGGRGTVAVATGISHTADGRWGHIATGKTQPSAVSRITGTLTCR